LFNFYDEEEDAFVYDEDIDEKLKNAHCNLEDYDTKQEKERRKKEQQPFWNKFFNKITKDYLRNRGNCQSLTERIILYESQYMKEYIAEFLFSGKSFFYNIKVKNGDIQTQKPIPKIPDLSDYKSVSDSMFTTIGNMYIGIGFILINLWRKNDDDNDNDNLNLLIRELLLNQRQQRRRSRRSLRNNPFTF